MPVPDHRPAVPGAGGPRRPSPRPVSAALALLAAVVLLLAGCGASAPKVVAGHGSPQAAALGFLQAATADDAATACGYVLPTQAQVCSQAFASGGALSASGLHLGRTTVDGDRALVTALGKLCTGTGDRTCFSSSDPSAGQPAPDLPFDAAYTAVEEGTSSDPNDPAVPCRTTGGQWYVDLGQTSSGASSQSSQGGQT